MQNKIEFDHRKDSLQVKPAYPWTQVSLVLYRLKLA